MLMTSTFTLSSRIGFLLAGLFILTVAVGQRPVERGVGRAAAQPDRVRVLTGLTLFDGSGGRPQQGVSIVITGEKVAEIAQGAPTEVPAGAETVDLSGYFCVPGLIDAHVHLATNPSREGYLGDTHTTLREFLGHGITDVRDMGGDGRVLAYLARQTLLHELPGPDIHFAAILAGPRFFADPRAASASQGCEVGTVPWAHIVRPDTDLDALMLQVKGLGATGVKLYASLGPDLTASVVEAARARDLMTWGHWVVAPRQTPALATVRAGMQVVSHAHMLMHDVGPAERASAERVLAGAGGATLFEEMVARGTILDATVVAALPLRTPPDWVRASDCAAHISKSAHAAGVLVATGSDRPAVDGVPAIHQEYSLLVNDAAFSPEDVLQSATRVSATAIGIHARRGTLQPGMQATMLLLQSDPRTSVQAWATPTFVIKRGVVYSGPNLRDSSATVETVDELVPR